MAENQEAVLNFTVHLDEVLGQGGFGTVYKATNNDNGEIVAAKKINLQARPNAHIREAVSFFNRPPVHDNLIELFQIHHHVFDFWVFMGYCQHGDLNDYFRNHFQSVLTVKPRLLLMRQIAMGLAYLHSKDIVHRDIKPANILVARSHVPEEAIVKITDLGLAKFLDPLGDSSGMSSNVGTERFKAPEFWLQDAAGKVRYHRNIDTFAAGLTFLAMLQAIEGERLNPVLENTLDAATEASNPIGLVMVMRQKAKQPSVNPVADKEDDSELTRGVKHVIRKMLQMTPEHRMTMQEVLDVFSDEQALIDLVSYKAMVS